MDTTTEAPKRSTRLSEDEKTLASLGCKQELASLFVTATQQYSLWSAPDLSSFCFKVASRRTRGIIELVPTTDTPPQRCSTYSSKLPLLIGGATTVICDVDDTCLIVGELKAADGCYPIVTTEDLKDWATTFRNIQHITYQLNNSRLLEVEANFNKKITGLEDELRKLKMRHAQIGVDLQAIKPKLREAYGRLDRIYADPELTRDWGVVRDNFIELTEAIGSTIMNS